VFATSAKVAGQQPKGQVQVTPLTQGFIELWRTAMTVERLKEKRSTR
jgi:hypothetical protein